MTHSLVPLAAAVYFSAGLTVLLIATRRKGLYANETPFMRRLFYVLVVLLWPLIFAGGVRVAILEQRKRNERARQALARLASARREWSSLEQQISAQIQNALSANMQLERDMEARERKIKVVKVNTVHCLAALLLTLTAGIASAQQTATFTFGEIQGQFGPAQPPNRCAAMTSWNGIAATDPNNPFPQNMGQICLNIYPNPYTSITIPWQLGFPNNGYLTNCAPTVWTPTPTNPYTPSPVDNGDGTGTNSFTVAGCYDGQNTTITATVNYEKVIISICGRYRCFHYVEWQVVGGSGTVVNE